MTPKVVEQAQSPISVQEAIQAFLTSSNVKVLQPGTIQEYQHELNRFATWATTKHLLLEQVNAKVIDAFLDYIKATSKPHQTGRTEISTYTLHSQVRVILTWLNWCLDDEDYGAYVKAETIRRIKKPKVIKTIFETFSVEQIATLRAACLREYNTHLRLRDETILLLLLDTGIRASELCGLTLANVDLSSEDAHVKVLGKGQKWGEIGLGVESRKYMARYLRQFRQPTFQQEVKDALKGKDLLDRQVRRIEQDMREHSLFFLNRAGVPLTPAGLNQLISRLGEWAEIEGVRCSPHTFRHTFASMFMRNGGDIYTLSKLLRHSSVKVTEEYLKSIRQWEARHHAQSVVDNL